MYRAGRIQSLAFLVTGVLIGTFGSRPHFNPELKAAADSGRFDCVTIVSPMFIYQGAQGVPLPDRRNGNVWCTQEAMK